jgi:hypothetical protein
MRLIPLSQLDKQLVVWKTVGILLSLVFVHQRNTYPLHEETGRTFGEHRAPYPAIKWGFGSLCLPDV